MPLRTTQESSRPRASDRSVVDTPYNRRLAQSHARVASSRLEAGAIKMENNINQRLLGAHQKPASFMLVQGWKSSNGSPLPVEGEIFFLTFPFIDQALSQSCAFCSPFARSASPPRKAKANRSTHCSA